MHENLQALTQKEVDSLPAAEQEKYFDNWADVNKVLDE